jgi:hypothetical protein
MALLSTAEYNQFTRFASADLPAPTKEQLTKIRFIAADNTVGRSLMTWSRKALESIAKKLVGMPFTINHDWDNIAESKGVIFDAKLYEIQEVPKFLIDNYALKDNTAIVNKQGWTPVVISVAFYDGDEILEQLAIGSGSKVSIGGFGPVTDILCPLCNCSFYNRDICSHVPPSPWYRTGENTAPYTVREDVEDMGECSLVLIPNSPSATIIDNRLASLFE